MTTCIYDSVWLMTPDLFTRAESAAAFVLSQTKLRRRLDSVLGSGLGSFADDLTEAVRIPYADIPTFPRSTPWDMPGNSSSVSRVKFRSP